MFPADAGVIWLGSVPGRRFWASKALEVDDVADVVSGASYPGVYVNASDTGVGPAHGGLVSGAAGWDGCADPPC